MALGAGVALRPDPNVIVKRLDGGTVLVHMGTNRIFELNDTGSKIWELLGQGSDAAAIVRQLMEEFDVDERHAADEVDRLLDELKHAHLLTP